MTSDHTIREGKVSFLCVLMSHIISEDHYFLLMIDAVMKDEGQGALCW